MLVASNLSRDVQFLWQTLRIVLLNFDVWNSFYDNLVAARHVKDFSRQAIPALLQVFSSAIGDAWASLHISPVTDEPQRLIQRRLIRRVGEDAAHALSMWVAGALPPAIILGEHFNPAALLAYSEGGGHSSNYLIRLRHSYSGLLVSPVPLQIIGQKLRQDNAPQRIFTDRVGEVKGKGKGKGEGRGRGAKGRGRPTAPAAHLPINLLVCPHCLKLRLCYSRLCQPSVLWLQPLCMRVSSVCFARHRKQMSGHKSVKVV